MTKKFSRDETAAIDRLEKGIESGTVLPVIGAGVSRQAAELPLLRSLLTDAIAWTHAQDHLQLSQENLKRLEEVNPEDPSPEYFQAWTRAAFCRMENDTHWETPEFREWLEATFNPSVEVVDDRIYKALQAMGPRIVATTNYDKLLSEHVMPDDPRVTWGEDDEIRDLFREGRGILHLHGICSRPESVILTSTDYTRVIAEAMRSEVARMLTSSAILLFIGISPEGVVDRHLNTLLKLGMGENGQRQERRPHVLLHTRKLTAKQKAALAATGVESIHFSESYTDLAPFLERLSRRRSDANNALELLGLDRKTGETLSESRWAPDQCLARVQTSLRFMGLRSSKWVDNGTFKALDKRLRKLDATGKEIVKFLILNPQSEAYERLERMRETKLTRDHLRALAQLEQEHESMVIKCVDFISAFRFTAVDGREIGLALYPTTPEEFEETNGGWLIPHTSIVTDRPWSLGRSLIFMFDEQFRDAKTLLEVEPDLFTS